MFGHKADRLTYDLPILSQISDMRSQNYTYFPSEIDKELPGLINLNMFYFIFVIHSDFLDLYLRDDFKILYLK